MGESLLDVLKQSAKKNGSSMREFFFLRDGDKRKVRFMEDLEDGTQVTFHSKWGEFNTPCLSHFGYDCQYCEMDDPEVKTYDQFAWSIYNWDENRRQIFMYKMSNATPIPQLMEVYEDYETLTDRDYNVKRKGNRTDTKYTIVPMDKKAAKIKDKPFTKKEVLDLIKAAFASPEDFEDDDDEEEEKPKKITHAKKSRPKAEPEPEEIDDEDEDEPEDEPEEEDESEDEVEDEPEDELDSLMDDDEEPEPKEAMKTKNRKKK